MNQSSSKAQTNPRRRLRRRSAWPRLAVLSVLGVAACGVTAHPHAEQFHDPNSDFATGAGVPFSSAGTAAVPTAGAVGVGFSGAPGSSSGGAPSANGGAATVSGGAATVSGGGPSGGASPASAGAPGAAAGAPPASGVTFPLGGVNVPKENVVAFIHVGHSNMQGQGTVPTASRPYHFTNTDPHAWLYHVGAPPRLALEPFTAGDPTQPGTPRGGPGTALVKEAAKLAPNTYFLSLGFAVPSAYCSQFVPGALYYDQLIAAPKAVVGKVTFGAIVIYLGITERHGTAADRANFPNCINTLVTAIRKDVGEPNLPLIMNDYEVQATGELAVGGAVANEIMPQIAKIPATVSNSVLIPCSAPLGMQDDHHFNLDGQLTWVTRALQAMKDKGWFVWH
jgi:Carbohydrate esterase, sialic acid-specific acetylesterase